MNHWLDTYYIKRIYDSVSDTYTFVYRNRQVTLTREEVELMTASEWQWLLQQLGIED